MIRSINQVCCFAVRLIFVFLILNTCFLILNTGSVYAQVFSLSPPSSTKSVGEEFIVDLNIDTQGQAVASADVKLTFDALRLEVVRVENGTFFTDEADYVGNGTVYIGGFFKDSTSTKTAAGKLAILTLKGKNNGSTQLAFTCSTAKDDSNIFDSVGNDIIKCSSITPGSYTFTGGTLLPSSTPTATASSTLVTSPTPSGLQPTPTPPQSGGFLPTVFFGAAGILLTIFGIAIIF